MKRLWLSVFSAGLIFAVIALYLVTQVSRLQVVFQRAEPKDGWAGAGVWLALLFEACVVLFGIVLVSRRAKWAVAGYVLFMAVSVLANLAYHYEGEWQRVVPAVTSVALPVGAGLLAVQFNEAMAETFGALAILVARRSRRGQREVGQGRSERSEAERTVHVPTVEQVLAEGGWTVDDLRAWWDSRDGHERYGPMVSMLRERVRARDVAKVLGKAESTIRGRWRTYD